MQEAPTAQPAVAVDREHAQPGVAAGACWWQRRLPHWKTSSTTTGAS